MKLIDRYVYAVTEHLPQDTREDISRELRANIEDMLPEVPTESDVSAVLLKLGNPSKLAMQYSDKKRYLIGPGLYDNYLTILKLVIGIVTAVFMCLTLVKWVFNHPIDGKFAIISIRLFIDILSSAIQGAVQGFIWVTAVFAILEVTGVDDGKIPFVKKKWSPNDLAAIPASKKRKISRIETTFSIFFTVFFTAILYFQSGLIGIYTKDSNGLILVSPLFVSGRLKFYIPIIIIFAIIQLSIFIWKFISMKWTLPLAITNAIHNTALSVFVYVILSDSSLFNPELLSKFADITKLNLSGNASTWLSSSLWISVIVFISISLLDSIMGFIKCKK
jgi:hypothetical protein